MVLVSYENGTKLEFTCHKGHKPELEVGTPIWHFYIRNPDRFYEDDCQVCLEEEVKRLKARITALRSNPELARLCKPGEWHSGVCVQGGRDHCMPVAKVRLLNFERSLSRFLHIPKRGDVVYNHDDPYFYGGQATIESVEWQPGRGHYIHFKEGCPGACWEDICYDDVSYGLKWRQNRLKAHYGERWAQDDSEGGHNTEHVE